MASTDSLPLPRKNVAYRAVFPIFDNTGALVTGAAGLDSEVSKDQGTFTDCTNEATEIATASGLYYLDITSTEMNADCTAVIVKTSTTNAKTTVLVFYPQESGDIKVDVQSWLTVAPNALTSGRVDAIVGAYASGQAPLQPTVAARTLDVSAGGEAGVDWANVGSPTTTVGLSGTTIATSQVVASVTGAVGSVTGAVGSVTGAVASVTAGVTVTTNNDKTGYTASTVSDKTGYTLSNAGVDAVLDRTDGVETGWTLRQALRLVLSALAGKLSGAATTTVTIRDVNDAKNRIVATVDASGNRSVVTKDVT